MADLFLPDEIPPVFRGGASVEFKPQEIIVDRTTGLVKPTHGISVNSMAERVVMFGGAYRVRGIPEGLSIIQRGQRLTHYEIVPTVPVTPERYQELLNLIELEMFIEEP